MVKSIQSQVFHFRDGFINVMRLSRKNRNSSELLRRPIRRHLLLCIGALHLHLHSSVITRHTAHGLQLMLEGHEVGVHIGVHGILHGHLLGRLLVSVGVHWRRRHRIRIVLHVILESRVFLGLTLVLLLLMLLLYLGLEGLLVLLVVVIVIVMLLRLVTLLLLGLGPLLRRSRTGLLGTIRLLLGAGNL